MFDLFDDTKAIKAISLWQPWASLIAAGLKRHETRHWPTSYRGPIAIHAAKRLDVAGAPEELCIAVFGKSWRDVLPLGAIVAVAQLTRCREARAVYCSLTEADRAAGNFAAGRWAWTLDHVQPLLPPQSAVGRQGLFNFSLDLEMRRRLEAAVDHLAACRYVGWA